MSGSPVSRTVHVYRYAILAALLPAMTGCVATAGPVQSRGPACEIGDQGMVRDTLYFGRNRPGGGTVRESEWRSFLDRTITPRFPDGLTVTGATGQWRGASGKVERERSEVVTVIHAGDPAARGKSGEIIDAYRRLFDQEAVLRERTATCVRF
jgi:hypothetical protein